MKAALLLICSLFGLSAADTANDDHRIIGGVQMTQNLPYYAQLLEAAPNSNNFEFICGASFYSNRVLLTAAHCITPGMRYRIRYGSHIRADPAITVDVGWVEVHESYNSDFFPYDLAALVLNARIQLGTVAQKILLSRNPGQANEAIQIYGFGRTASWVDGDPIPPISNILKTAEVRVLDQPTCEFYYSTLFPTSFVRAPRNSYICYVSNTNNTCSGDSGGPSFRANTPYQIGLTSFGPDNCQAFANGIYLDIHTHILYPPFLAWIKQRDHYI